jgi:hypothetical protein
MFVWMKNLIQMFFMTSHECDYLYRIEIGQWTHMYYVIKYFIKFGNHLNGSF